MIENLSNKWLPLPDLAVKMGIEERRVRKIRQDWNERFFKGEVEQLILTSQFGYKIADLKKDKAEIAEMQRRYFCSAITLISQAYRLSKLIDHPLTQSEIFDEIDEVL